MIDIKKRVKKFTDEKVTEEMLATTEEEQKSAKALSKRIDSVLKEMQRKFKPKGLSDRIAYNLTIGNFRNQIKTVASALKPELTRQYIRVLVSRFMWILEEGAVILPPTEKEIETEETIDEP